MHFDKDRLRLYAVTDRSWLHGQTLRTQVEAALQGGVTCVQLREKQLDRESFIHLGRTIGCLCQRYGVPLIINDDLEVALACGADGVHVGQDDLPVEEVRRRVGDKLIVGVSAHNPEEARRAYEGGADYLGAGAVFGSTTKTNVTALSHETLRAICDAVPIPVVAIGGITRENLPRLAGTGVAGVAVVSAIFAADDITAASRELRALSDAMTQNH